MSFQTLNVELGERSYPIYIGDGILQRTSLIDSLMPSRQILVVTNTVVAPLYLARIKDWLQAARADCQVEVVELPDGEQYKNLGSIEKVFDQLMHLGFNRHCLIVALGGGVIGDMAGFAAACYQRGVPFVQVPTTLLSQVDSSVGGKTGVNHPLGKNMIGAFYQPQAVYIDTDVLVTLPDRELAAGLAEVVKYGLIADAEFFAWLEQNMDKLLAKDRSALQYAIMRSCEIKAQIVGQDEKESGIRAILNLGHTYGHAIETEMGYGEWLHGEAVAAGMVMACELSQSLGWLPDDVVGRTKQLLLRARLPISPPSGRGAAAFLRHMKVDKKVVDGRVRLVLLSALGRAVVTSDFDPDAFQKQLAAL